MADHPPPPPPPPHGSNPKTTRSGLPDGNYDIFIIPPHSSGSGFLYLPSLAVQRNSFLAGVACTLLTIAIWTAAMPALKSWTAMLAASGSAGVVLLVAGVAVVAWAFGKTQGENTHGREPPPSSSSGGGGPPPHAPPPRSSHDYSSYNSHGSGPKTYPHGSYQQWTPPNSPPPPPPPRDAGPDPFTRSNPPPPPPQDPQPDPFSRSYANYSAPPPPQPPPTTPRPPPPQPPPQAPQPPPQAPQPPPQAPQPPPPTPQPPPPPPPSQEQPPQSPKPDPKATSAAWEKAREETRRREEAKKRAEELRRMREENQRKKEEAERLVKAAAEKIRWEQQRQREKETREREARERLAKEKVEKENAQREKDKKERETRERLEKQKQDIEKAARERVAADAAAKAKLAAATSPPSSSSSSDTVRPPYVRPSAQSYASTDISQERPRGRPASTLASSISSYTESSYAPSTSTARTSPPPTYRNLAPYETKDPDKVVIKGVYMYSKKFPNPISQLVSGENGVTDGLILRITTEGLFIDDDVRSVPQREWDIKAWGIELVEYGLMKPFQVLKASIKDADRRYVFVLPSDQAVKVDVGLTRLKKGALARSLKTSGLKLPETKKLLGGLGYIS